MEQKLIQKLVKAMQLKKNQIVLLNLWGDESDKTYAYNFAQSIAVEGAMPMLLIHSSEYYEKLFNSISEEVSEKWYSQFDCADVIIDLICHNPGMPPIGLKKEKYPIYGAYLRGLFGRFGKKEKFIQITLPTETNALEVGMGFDEYKERILKAMDIDYEQLKLDCQLKVDSFNGNTRIIRTGKDCVLTIDTTGRNWNIDAGDGVLPCGEVYIAPIEEKSNGTVFFETLSAQEAGIFTNVTVTIQDGKMISSDSEEFNSFLSELPEGGNVVGELGIGMNPNVECITGDSALDENVIGTFHIAIGMNTLFGGKNNSPIHMDFVAFGEVE